MIIKSIKDIIHYTLIYFGVYFPIYLFLSKKLQVDVYNNYWYSFSLILVSLFISNIVEKWYKSKD